MSQLRDSTGNVQVRPEEVFVETQGTEIDKLDETNEIEEQTPDIFNFEEEANNTFSPSESQQNSYTMTSTSNNNNNILPDDFFKSSALSSGTKNKYLTGKIASGPNSSIRNGSEYQKSIVVDVDQIKKDREQALKFIEQNELDKPSFSDGKKQNILEQLIDSPKVQKIVRKLDLTKQTSFSDKTLNGVKSVLQKGISSEKNVDKSSPVFKFAKQSEEDEVDKEVDENLGKRDQKSYMEVMTVEDTEFDNELKKLKPSGKFAIQNSPHFCPILVIFQPYFPQCLPIKIHIPLFSFTKAHIGWI